jgi:hypothetical protein
MVNIPDTKVFALKLLAERFKRWSLPYNHRLRDAADILKTKPIRFEAKQICTPLQQMAFSRY